MRENHKHIWNKSATNIFGWFVGNMIKNLTSFQASVSHLEPSMLGFKNLTSFIYLFIFAMFPPSPKKSADPHYPQLPHFFATPSPPFQSSFHPLFCSSHSSILCLEYPIMSIEVGSQSSMNRCDPMQPFNTWRDSPPLIPTRCQLFPGW